MSGTRVRACVRSRRDRNLLGAGVLPRDRSLACCRLDLIRRFGRYRYFDLFDPSRLDTSPFIVAVLNLLTLKVREISVVFNIYISYVLLLISNMRQTLLLSLYSLIFHDEIKYVNFSIDQYVCL